MKLLLAAYLFIQYLWEHWRKNLKYNISDLNLKGHRSVHKIRQIQSILGDSKRGILLPVIFERGGVRGKKTSQRKRPAQGHFGSEV